jgi:hypothetical protein
VSDLLAGNASVDPFFKRERLIKEFDQDEMVRAQERLYAEILSRKGRAEWRPS